MPPTPRRHQLSGATGTTGATGAGERGRRHSGAGGGLLWCLLSLLVTGNASADGPLQANGEPIETSKYAIDLGAGPVVAGSRVTGLAGAYVAIGEDVDGNPQNPAAPAMRPAYSLDHFDYHLGVGVLFPAALTANDFFNSGADNTRLSNRADDTAMVTLAANLQWGTVGFGLMVDGQTYRLGESLSTGQPEPDAAETGALDANIGGVRLQVANAFVDGQLVVGVGTRVIGMTIQGDDGKTLFDTRSTGYEGGALFRPNGAPYRAGMAFQSSVTTGVDSSSALQPDEAGDIIATDASGHRTYLPDAVQLPWRLDVGAAYQWGPRPLNPRWLHPHRYDKPMRSDLRRERDQREKNFRTRIIDARLAGDLRKAGELEEELEAAEDRDEMELENFELGTREVLRGLYRRLPRRYLLVSAQLNLRGASRRAVGVESFLQGTVNRSGKHVSASPRIGVESEVLPNLLRLRGGFYYEPTRFQTSSGRIHGTIGLDLRVLQWSVFGIYPDNRQWRVGGVLDLARRYFGWGLTVGGWY